MPVKFNGTTITAIKYAGKTLTKLIYNGKLVFETIKPSVSITSPSSGATLNTARPAISFKLTDADSGVDITTLSLQLDSTTYKYNSSGVSYSAITNGYNVSFTPPSNLSDGSHSVCISVKDKFGNNSSLTTRSFTISTWTTVTGTSFLPISNAWSHTGNNSTSALSSFAFKNATFHVAGILYNNDSYTREGHVSIDATPDGVNWVTLERRYIGDISGNGGGKNFDYIYTCSNGVEYKAWRVVKSNGSNVANLTTAVITSYTRKAG